MKTKGRRRSPSSTEKHYRALLSEVERSGESVAEFAERRGLSPWPLYTWRSRLGLARGRAGRPPTGQRTPKAAGRLLEVSIGEPPRAEDRRGLVLYVQGRHRLELPRDIAADDLVRVVRALSSC